MKRISLFLGIFLVFLFPTLVFAQNSAKNVSTQKIVTLSEGETVDGDYFAAGELVEIFGTVNGDVYAAGGQVLVNGTINGDLLVAGGNVTIEGTVTDDIRAAGGSVLIGAEVFRNVTVVGGNVQFFDDSFVTGNVTAGTGNLILGGTVEQNVKAGAGNLTITNRVGGDVEAGVGNLRIASQSVIGGDLIYWSEEEAQIDSAAQLDGQITRRDVPSSEYTIPDQDQIFGALKGVDLFLGLTSLISTLILGIILVSLLPRYTDETRHVLQKGFWKSLLFGIIAIIGTPIVIFLLFITVFTIPLSFVLLAVYFVTIYIARIFAMYAIGSLLIQLIKTKSPQPAWIFVIGLVLYYLLSLIPILGWFVKAIVVTAGFGAMMRVKYRTYLRMKKAKLL